MANHETGGSNHSDSLDVFPYPVPLTSGDLEQEVFEATADYQMDAWAAGGEGVDQRTFDELTYRMTHGNADPPEGFFDQQ